MTEMIEAPVVGAAMPSTVLETYRDWLIDQNRDLELQDFFMAEVLDGDWRPKAKAARQLLGNYRGRLGIHGPFWGFSIGTQDPEVRKVVRRRLDQGLDVCEELGATMMVVHSPYTTWDHHNLDNSPTGRTDLIERVHAALDGVVERAGDLGVMLVIENIEDKDPLARVELVRSFAVDHVRVSLDTGHAFYAHGSTGAPPVDYYIAAAGDLLSHVHLQDADGYADRHWPLGEGSIPWPSVFGALAQLSSNPRLIIELRDKTMISASFDYLRQHGMAR